MAATIRPIETKSVHQIQSGQVIVDLCSVVKELVENALDAAATAIEVKLDNYGLDRITVQDNGTGIAEANYEAIALKHHTSKLSTFDDLSSLKTFGFRGEALSSLCALSTFSLTTAQAHEAPRGRKLEFELSGKLKSATFVAAQKGTIASVEHIFSRLPVRQRELSKNIKREYGKVIGLLHGYACISTGVKFIVRNSTPKSKPAVVFSTNGNATTRENIANVYGTKMLAQLIELDLRLDDRSGSDPLDESDKNRLEVHLHGLISKPTLGEGRQTPDRQMCFINGRPCGLPQLTKAVNEVYKSFNASQSPFIFADFRMDTDRYDVNVTPDKKTIYLHDATALTERLKTALIERFDQVDQTVPQSQFLVPKPPTFRQLTIIQGDRTNTEALSRSKDSDSDDHGELAAPNVGAAREFESNIEPERVTETRVDRSSGLDQQEIQSETRSEQSHATTWHRHISTPTARSKGTVGYATDTIRARQMSPQLATITIGDRVIKKMIGTPKNGRDTSPPYAPDDQAVRDQDADHVMALFTQRRGGAHPRSRMPDPDKDVHSISVMHAPAVERSCESQVHHTTGGVEFNLAEDEARVDEQSRVQALIELAEHSAEATKSERQQRHLLISKSSSQRDTLSAVVACLDVDIASIARLAQERCYRMSTQRQDKRRLLLKQDSLFSTDEERLSLTIQKTDFTEMHITGQFNLGFIIAVRHGAKDDKARQKDELFIVDQHASDEKYNFERLQTETTVENQRLVHPIKLDLTAIEEEIVLENPAALEQNGFVIDTDVSGDKAVGQRCELISLPLSKEVTFNERDLEELIHLLSEAQINSASSMIPRPSKVRKMFAMRACRSSIMIGKALSHKQMGRVLEHMGTIDKPWNCPHGRPTMRHLISLDTIESQLWREGDGLIDDSRQDTKNIWQTFLT